IIFYDKIYATYNPHNFELGLSNELDTFGTRIYLTPTLPNNTSWTKRAFAFTAPYNGKYITIRTSGKIGNWTLVDNFKVDCFNNFFEDTMLCEGDILTLSPNLAGASYKWNDNSTNNT